MTTRMGGNSSRLHLTRFLRRPERDRSDTEEEGVEGWPIHSDENETSGDESLDNGSVQDMLRYLLRYRLISRSLKLNK